MLELTLKLAQIIIIVSTMLTVNLVFILRTSVN